MEDKVINKVFICSNNKQLIGAKVSRYTLEKYRKTDSFEVVILNTDEGSELDRLAGHTYLRELAKYTVLAPLTCKVGLLARFSPPEKMKYQSKAVVIDPDVFSVGADVGEL